MRVEDAIRSTRMSIVQMSITQGNAAPMPIGTGFLVGSGRYMVTAKHVVDAAPAAGSLVAGLAGVDRDEADLELRASFVYVPTKLIAEDPINDVALLELEMPPDAVSVELSVTAVDTGEVYTSGRTRPVKFSALRPREGTEIVVSGFPLRAPSLVSTQGIIASTFAPLDPNNAASPIAYLCDVTAIGGNSGGPVYRVSDGAVIGLCRAVRVASVGSSTYTIPLTVVTPVQYIIALMEGAGIDPGQAKGVTPPVKKPGRR
jgi:serine protease Do